MTFKALSDTVYVSGQISLQDIEIARSLGVRTIISNRPDAEEPGQPTANELAQAAAALGLGFIHAPTRGLPDATVLEAVGAALSRDETVLMFCRSGMRSAAAWALSMHLTGRMGRDPLVAAAAKAGYDLASLPLD